MILVSLGFVIFTVIWIFLLGFGSPIILVSGFIFGKWLGVFLATISMSTGALLLYIFANYFFKDVIKNKFLNKFKNLESKFKKNEFIFFLIYRFVGGIPFQVANLLPVLFNVKIKNYFFGSFLGLIPQCFIMASLGSGIEKIIKNNDSVPSIKTLILSSEIYLPILAFMVLIVITLILKKIFYNE
jgi:uncharacterized membrane protein YdjX (TVP38/TMEM64 family)